MKRRILSMLLVFALMLTMSAVIFAEGTDTGSEAVIEEVDDKNPGGARIKEVRVKSDTSKMRFLIVSDLHYICGSVLAYNNPYLINAHCYNIPSDEKVQEFVDSVLRENYMEEIDAVIFLGDIAYNDKPFQRETKNYRDALVENDSTKSDYRNWTDEEWQGWHDHMMTNFYKSEHDTIWHLKDKFLDQLSDAGIPYYVTPGNHDPYTFEMWEQTFGNPVYDKNGNLVQDAHMFFTYNEDGSIFSTDYMLTFPEFDTAFAMLDSYAYEEEDPTCHKPVERVLRYFEEDTLIYTPIQTDERRTANFNEMVEAAKDYKHFYIGTHHFGGPTMEDPYTNPFWDTEWVAENGNKYGNLRWMPYGHDHTYVRGPVSTTNGSVPTTCLPSWSTVEGGSWYDKDTGEKRPLIAGLVLNVPGSGNNAWGYMSLESDDTGVSFQRIKVDMTYYHHQGFEDYLLQHIGSHGYQGVDDWVSTPYEMPYTVEYKRDAKITLYTETEG